MKKKIGFFIILFTGLLIAADSPYARRIRPFVGGFPGSCIENEVGYDMTGHTFGICTNLGYQTIPTGSSGITNSAGANVFPLSDGTNLITSVLSQSGTVTKSVNINGNFTPTTTGLRNLGSTTISFANLYLGNITARAQITGSSITADRILTLPDETGTICTTGSICSGYQASGTYATSANNLSFFASTTSAQLRTLLSDENGTGVDLFDSSTSATFITPILGTPTSVTLTNGTGLPISTGVSGLGTNMATFLATPSGANLAATVTDETGSGLLMFATSPRITTSLLDTNGNAMFAFTATASAVDGFTFTNAATANPATVTLAATGTDTNINLKLLNKGSGTIVAPNGTLSNMGISFNANDSQVGIYGVAGGMGFVSGGNLLLYLNGGTGQTVVSSQFGLNFANGSPNGTVDTGLTRAAANVIEINNGTGGGAGWLKQNAGRCFLAADQTNATTTFANITGCSITVTSGRKYTIRAVLYLSDSTAADGAKIDFNGGSVTATNFRVHCTAFDTALNLSSQGTALSTAYAASTFTGNGMFECYGTFEPSSTSTFIPRIAQNAHTVGTLTLARGSHILMEDMP